MGPFSTRFAILMRFCDDRENNSDELIYAGTVIIMQRVNNARMPWRKPRHQRAARGWGENLCPAMEYIKLPSVDRKSYVLSLTSKAFSLHEH